MRQARQEEKRIIKTHEVKKTWLQLISNYSNNLSLQQELLTEIITAYNEPGRFYHNFNHLIYLVELASQYQTQINDFDTLLFSIFYHDVIYRIKQNNNEIKSAELAKKRLISINYPDQKIKKCFRQIKATKNHKVSDESDTNWLLDLDLAILGEEKSRYIEYANNIRKEYRIYPDHIYNQGRRKVLKKLLLMNSIYKTKSFQDNFEIIARENLNWELEQLVCD